MDKVEETLVCLFNIKRNHCGEGANFQGLSRIGENRQTGFSSICFSFIMKTDDSEVEKRTGRPMSCRLENGEAIHPD